MIKPFNFQRWLDANRDQLKPPVGNKNLTPDAEDFIVMVVAGPNARKDYHLNETEEFFYQLEGRITVRTQENGQPVDHVLESGDMMIVPANTPHSPIREAGSVGLVVERTRVGKGFIDGLAWYCEGCNHKLHEVHFELKDVEVDFQPHFRDYYHDVNKRTCDQCSAVMATDSRFTD